MKLKEVLQQIKTTQEKLDIPEIFICGGTPRDRYMKRLDHISDLDLTNGTTSVQYLAQELYNDLNKKYQITKKDMPDGHSTLFFGNLKMDFSTNFIVPEIEKYLSNIPNPSNLQKEIFSRDFTCNALLLSLNLKNVIDLTHNSLKDIDNKMIKTCLEPQITLTTNKNRVIRSIYLACKLDFNIDPKIISFVATNPKVVQISTQKSLNDKLTEAFKYDPDKASFLLGKMNLWNYIPITEQIFPYYEKIK